MVTKKPRFQTTPERMLQLAKLKKLVDSTPDGETLTWLDVMSATQIKMDNAGRSLFRRAIGNRPYATINGTGVCFSSPKNAESIVVSKLRRVDGAARKAAKTTEAIVVRHSHELADAARKNILRVNAFFGTVKLLSAETRVNVVK